MRELTEPEIAHFNGVVAHAERLVNARGRIRGNDGTYESASFAIAITSEPGRSGLRVQRHGVVVFEATWRPGLEAGYLEAAPGDWPGELLALPAAHS